MNRRKYLLAFGAVSTCGLTGCNALTGGSKGGSATSEPTLVEGPAQFTDFKIKMAEKATVDTTVDVTVSGFNYGTKPGRFSGVLAAVEGAGAVSKPIELTDVDAGSRAETTVKLSFSSADEYVLGVIDAPVGMTETVSRESLKSMGKTRIRVTPKTAAVGKSFDLDTDLQITLTDVTYQ